MVPQWITLKEPGDKCMGAEIIGVDTAGLLIPNRKQQKTWDNQMRKL
jgi:hypothetical protein